MAVKKDRVQVTVFLDGKQGINELGKLEMQAFEYRNELKKLKKGTADWINKNNELTKVKKKINSVRKELGITGMTMRQLRNYQRDLNRELLDVTKGTARYKELNAQLRQVNHRIAVQRVEMRGLNQQWTSMLSNFKSFGLFALGYVGLTTITSQIRKLTSKLGLLSDELASVRKTTGLTQEDVESLDNTLEELDTKTARSELLGMAKIAGKLGITSKKDIEGFVSAADKISVALGEDLGDPEQNLRALGKLINVFKINKKFDIETGLLKVGSAINHLGKSSEANEGFIVDFTSRLGGVAPLAGISMENVLGLAAASDALGLRVETATTALSKLLIKMTQERELFAKYTKDIDGNNLSLKEFSRLIATDANEAFLSLLRGVKDNSQGMIELSDTLDTLGLDGGRVVGVLGTLAGGIDLITAQQKISREEFEKGTSVLNEFGLMNDTLQAKLLKIGKAITLFFVNSRMVKGLEKLVNLFEDIIEVPISESILEQQMALLKMEVKLKQTNLSEEERLNIIRKLQNEHPKYLASLDAEKVSNDELFDKIKAVNEQLINRIIIQRKQEEIDQLNEDIATRKLNVHEKEKDLTEELIKLSKKHNIEIESGADVLEMAIKFQERLNQLREEGKIKGPRGRLFDDAADLGFQISELSDAQGFLANLEDFGTEVRKERDKLKLELFGDESENNALNMEVSGSVNQSIITGPSKEQLKSLRDFQKEIEKVRREILIGGLEADQQEIVRAENKYEALKNKLDGFHSQGVISEKELKKMLLELERLFDEELDIIFDDRNKRHLEQRDQFLAGLDEILLSGREAEEKMVNDEFDQLIKKAEEFGISTERIEEARQKKLLQIKNKYRGIDLENEKAHKMAIAGMISEIGEITTQLNNLIAGQSEELAVFQILLAQSSILVNQAVALSAAVKGAADAAAATGPAAPFTIGPLIAAMIGTVLATFAQIGEVLNKAEKPKAPTFRSFFHGGDTNDSPGLGFGDKHGEFSGFTHFNEFVHPAFLAHDPVTMDARRLVQARMEGYTLSQTNTPQPKYGEPSSTESQQDNTEMIHAINQLTEMLAVLMSKGVHAYFSPETFDEATEYRERRDRIAQNGL